MPQTGKMQWYFQYTPNDNRDYDAAGPQILVDTKVNGEDRKIVSTPIATASTIRSIARNGQFLKATQYSAKVTWTKGIDPKTGKPVDYDAGKDVQIFSARLEGRHDRSCANACPDVHGGTNFWPPSYSQKTKLLYIGGNEGCANITPDRDRARERQVRWRRLCQRARITGIARGGRPGLRRAQGAQGSAVSEPSRRAHAPPAASW